MNNYKIDAPIGHTLPHRSDSSHADTHKTTTKKSPNQELSAKDVRSPLVDWGWKTPVFSLAFALIVVVLLGASLISRIKKK